MERKLQKNGEIARQFVNPFKSWSLKPAFIPTRSRSNPFTLQRFDDSTPQSAKNAADESLTSPPDRRQNKRAPLTAPNTKETPGLKLDVSDLATGFGICCLRLLGNL